MNKELALFAAFIVTGAFISGAALAKSIRPYDRVDVVSCRSASMAPMIDCRDRIYYKLGADGLHVGDIVVYKAHGEPHGYSWIVHQVVAVEAGGVVTKGIANDYDDGLIPYKDVLGRVVKVVKVK